MKIIFKTDYKPPIYISQFKKSIMKTKYATIIFLIILFTNSCKQEKEIDNDFTVIKVGEFFVNSRDFAGSFNKLQTVNRNLTQQEQVLLLLDNYISSGLLIESAKKLNLDHSEEFKDKFLRYEKQLIVKYNKLSRIEKNGIAFKSIDDKLDMHNLQYCIDLVRIPKIHKDIKDQMLDFFNQGAEVYIIYNNPEFENWKNKGLSVFRDVPIHSVCLTNKVITEVGKMQEGEIKLIKEPMAYYLIRKKQFISPSYNFIDHQSNIKVNIAMAECIEQGDTIFNDYQIKNTIICNDDLLQEIDFSISPLTNFQERNDTIIAMFCGQSISVNTIKHLIKDLPVEIQSYFYNKSTRKKAIATLILSNFEPYESAEYQDFIYKKYYIKLIKDEINKNVPKDTVQFLKKWISRELRNSNTNMLLPVFIEKAKHVARNISDPGEITFHSEQKIVKDWLSPKNMRWHDYLQLNYPVIDNLEVFEDDSINDNKVLAYSNNWKLKVKDFKDELNNLTPETRIGIAENNLATKMIRYLANQSIKENEGIRINSNLLSTTSIVGNSFDLLNFVVNENDIVGTIGGITIKVNELRKLVDGLSESDKSKFINSVTRKENFNNILLNKYWLKIDPNKNALANNLNYKSEMTNCQNHLLAETFYNEQLKINDIILTHYNLNLKLQKAIIDLNKERLNDFLAKVKNEFPIKVNINHIKTSYKVEISSSKYSSNIKNLN